MRFAVTLSALTLAACPMSTPDTPTDAGAAVDAGPLADAGSPASDAGPVASERCPEALPSPPDGQECLVEGAGEERLLGGTLLLEDKTLTDGWVFVNASGAIACVGCDCAAQATTPSRSAARAQRSAPA